MRAIIEGKKVEESSSSEAEEEEEESEEEGGPEKEIPLEKPKNKKTDQTPPLIKEVDIKQKDLDDTKDGLLNKVYEVEMGSEEDEGDNEQLYEDLQRIKQK